MSENFLFSRKSCTFAKGKQPYELMKVLAMTTIKELDTEEISEIICSLWEPLTSSQRDMLSQNISVERFKKNEMIYKESEHPTKMMFLLRGKVKIFKEGMGHSQIIRVIKPFEIFGYRAYFAGEEYKTNAMAFEPSTVAFIPMTVIAKLMGSCQSITQSIIRHLATELGNSDERTISLTQKHIRGRLAEALLLLKESYGVEEDGHTLNIYLTREDIANLSNMKTSNAIRTLSTFTEEDLISTDGRKIRILKEEELRKISRYG